jgi:hypothetical protein
VTPNHDTSPQAGDQTEQADTDQSAIPDDPRSHPAETVDALEERVEGPDQTPDDPEVADDSPPNPDDDDMTDLPGPTGGEAGEPSG